MEEKKTNTAAEQVVEIQRVLQEYLRIINQQAAKGAQPKIQEATHLGEIIKEARKAQGITQQELGNLAELSIGTIVQIEKDHRRVTFENVERVLKILGKTLWIK